HLRRGSLEVRRRGEIIRESKLGGTEARCWIGGYRANTLAGKLIDDRVNNVGTVIRQQILATETIEVDVADAVGGADHRLGEQLVGQTDARGPILACWMNQ